MSRVRITGGQWRSRMLNVTSATGLRPTPDRVRETLFNWLGQQLDGWRCLDLFAGSGALGFEAASRGAGEVVMVEFNPRVFALLKQHAQALGADQVELVRSDALKFAASASRPYDLVMLDPPYNKGWIERLEPHLEALVASDGWLYIEAEVPVESLGEFEAVKSGRAGQVCFQLLKRRGGA